MNRVFTIFLLLVCLLNVGCSKSSEPYEDLFTLAVVHLSEGTVKMGKHTCEIMLNEEAQYVDVCIEGEYDSFSINRVPEWSYVTSSNTSLRIRVGNNNGNDQRVGTIEFTVVKGKSHCTGRITLVQS